MDDRLLTEAARLADADLNALAEARAGHAVIEAAGWRVHLARHRLDSQAEAALLAFGEERGLTAAIASLFAGETVNPSEGRAALHWALRAPAPLAGEAEAVRQSVAPALDFAGAVASGRVTAADNGPFTALVHVGIGGSDFGPRLIADAFHLERNRAIDLRFCANLDPIDLTLALDGLDPKRTLLVGVSKSFGTEETLYNLGHARAWLQAGAGPGWPGQTALVTANPDRARAWLGEAADSGHLFDMPLSVGGRFSLWSAASLACAVAIGPERVRALLAGAAQMDAHVREAPLASNLAAQLALLDAWNTSVLGYPMRVLLAYARRLRLLPAYLQQLEMESNGKSVGPDGNARPHATAPALWGGEGSIGQHSYHQWLHQGSEPVPGEFILAREPGVDADGARALSAHALAQAEVLANGRSLDDIRADEPDLAAEIAAQKVHAGGRPSTFLSCSDFSPARLGALIALYEHRTYLAGVLWGVNSFDQWGVERGKVMAGRLKAALTAGKGMDDPVTQVIAGDLAGL